MIKRNIPTALSLSLVALALSCPACTEQDAPRVDTGTGTESTAALQLSMAGLEVVPDAAREATTTTPLYSGTMGVHLQGTLYGETTAYTFTSNDGNTGTVTPASGTAPLLYAETATIYAGYPYIPANSAADAGYNQILRVAQNDNSPFAARDGESYPAFAISTDAINYAPAISGDAGDASDLDFTSAATDYMYGVKYTDNGFTTEQPTANFKNASVTIGLKHAFSQIQFVIIKGTGYYQAGNISSITYTRDGAPKLQADNGSAMNLHDGSITTTAASASGNALYTFDLSNKTGLAATTDVGSTPYILTTYALPCKETATATQTSTFTITVDGKDMQADLSTLSQVWEAGKKYVYTFRFGPTGMTLVGVAIKGWDTGEGTGDAKPEGYAMTINADIAGTGLSGKSKAEARETVASSPTGSAMYDRDKFYDGDQIRILQTKGDVPTLPVGTTNECNYQLTLSGSKETWVATPVANGLNYIAGATYRAFYPVTHDRILLDQSTAEYFRQSNLMQSRTLTPTSTQLSFTGGDALTHAYSRVTLKFALKSTPAPDYTFTFSGNGIQDGTTTGTQYIRMLKESESDTYTAIVAPITNTGGGATTRTLNVSLIVGGVTYPARLQCACAVNTHYTYTLTIHNDILVSTSHSIAEWETGTTTSGELTEDQTSGEAVTEPAITE